MVFLAEEGPDHPLARGASPAEGKNEVKGCDEAAQTFFVLPEALGGDVGCEEVGMPRVHPDPSEGLCDIPFGQEDGDAGEGAPKPEEDPSNFLVDGLEGRRKILLTASSVGHPTIPDESASRRLRPIWQHLGHPGKGRRDDAFDEVGVLLRKGCEEDPSPGCILPECLKCLLKVLGGRRVGPGGDPLRWAVTLVPGRDAVSGSVPGVLE